MAFTLSTTWATTRKDFTGGDGGLAGDISITFDVAATTTILKGQFLKLTSGFAALVTATTDQPVGVAMKAVDNSTGAAGDLEVAMLVRGIAQVNAFVAKTGIAADYDDALVPFTKVGLSDNGVASMAGQSVSSGADPTIPVGTMLSTNATSAAAGQTVKALVYIDLLGQQGVI